MDLKQHMHYKSKSPWLIFAALLVAIFSVVLLKQKLSGTSKAENTVNIHFTLKNTTLPDSLFPMVFILNNEILFSIHENQFDTALNSTINSDLLLLMLLDNKSVIQYADTIMHTSNTSENFRIILSSLNNK